MLNILYLPTVCISRGYTSVMVWEVISLTSSYPLAHMVWKHFAFDEKHKEAVPVQAHMGKVSYDSVMHQPVSGGDGTCHSRPQATGVFPSYACILS